MPMVISLVRQVFLSFKQWPLVVPFVFSSNINSSSIPTRDRPLKILNNPIKSCLFLFSSKVHNPKYLSLFTYDFPSIFYHPCKSMLNLLYQLLIYSVKLSMELIYTSLCIEVTFVGGLVRKWKIPKGRWTNAEWKWTMREGEQCPGIKSWQRHCLTETSTVITISRFAIQSLTFDVASFPALLSYRHSRKLDELAAVGTVGG